MAANLATVLCLERLVGSQLADVVNCATEDGDLRDPAITVSAWYHVAQTVEVKQNGRQQLQAK